MITAEELYYSADRERYELVRGTLEAHEPPGGAHGRIAACIAHLLREHVERHGLGTVLVESGYVLRRAPDTVRGPDVSFISGVRLAPDQIPEQFISVAPDLAVEILSPRDRVAEIDERVADYFAGGTRCVWIVDPRSRQVVVCDPGDGAKTLTMSDVLDGEDVVPGFQCRLAEVFGTR